MMFNANHLQEATQQVKQNKSTEQVYQQACENLTLCINSQFSHPQALTAAMDGFAELMQKEPYNPRAFVAAAYILITGLARYQEAQPYLDYALSLDPKQAMALELKATLPTLIEVKTYHHLIVLPDGPIDYDQLYDETEQQIITQVQVFAEAQSQFQFTVDTQALQVMLQHYDAIRVWIQGIKNRIERIDEEIDSSELYLKLKQLEVLAQRFAHILTFSQVLINLKKQIETWIQRLRLEIQACNPNASEVINTYLDQADVWADYLDNLEQNKVPIQWVTETYELFVALIEQWQESIDN